MKRFVSPWKTWKQLFAWNSELPWTCDSQVLLILLNLSNGIVIAIVLFLFQNCTLWTFLRWITWLCSSLLSVKRKPQFAKIDKLIEPFFVYFLCVQCCEISKLFIYCKISQKRNSTFILVVWIKWIWANIWK